MRPTQFHGLVAALSVEQCMNDPSGEGVAAADTVKNLNVARRRLVTDAVLP